MDFLSNSSKSDFNPFVSAKKLMIGETKHPAKSIIESLSQNVDQHEKALLNVDAMWEDANIYAKEVADQLPALLQCLGPVDPWMSSFARICFSNDQALNDLMSHIETATLQMCQRIRPGSQGAEIDHMKDALGTFGTGDQVIDDFDLDCDPPSLSMDELSID
jgi:hypothetical protein